MYSDILIYIDLRVDIRVCIDVSIFIQCIRTYERETIRIFTYLYPYIHMYSMEFERTYFPAEPGGA